MEAEFYDGKASEEYRQEKGGQILTREKLMPFFRLEKASTADRSDKAEPFLFEGPATAAHKKEYPDQYAAYLEKKLAAIKSRKE